MGKGGRYWDQGEEPKATTRRRLLQQMIEAEESAEQAKVDEALVAAKLWLRQYGFDWAILDSCAKLRGTHLPPTSLKEGDPT